MAITLPLPVRVAAGLVATGIRVVRSLPEEIPAIPVAIVGNAMKLSMRVQQEITTLATRGDELLGGIIGAGPQENPSWATFDEDKPAPAAPRARPAAAKSTPRTTTSVRVANTPSVSSDRAKPGADTPDNTASADHPSAPDSNVAEPPAPAAIRIESTRSDPHTPEAAAMSETETTATEPAAGAATGAAAEVSDAVIEATIHAVPGSSDPAPTEHGPTDPAPAEHGPAEHGPAEHGPAEHGPADPAPADPASAPDDATPADEPPAPNESSGPEADGPAALPGYDGMTLAQVRGHLRDLTAEDVSTLLAYEQSGDNRAPFLTLLSNRLVTLGVADS